MQYMSAQYLINWHERASGTAYTMLLMGVLGIQLMGPAATTATYVGLSIWALRGSFEAIQALTITWLIGSLNPALFRGSDAEEILRWVVVLSCFCRVLLDLATSQKLKIPRPIIILTPFVAVVGVASIAVSYATIVSLFKLTIFYVGCITVLYLFWQGRYANEQWHSWFSAFFAVVVVASFPLIGHNLGYVRNQSGFQGLLSHPQTYGIFLPMALAYASGRLWQLGSNRRLLIIVIIGLVSLYATEARTGVLALVGGGALVAFTAIISKIKREGITLRVRRNLIFPSAVAGIFLALVLTFAGEQLTKATVGFILKGGNARMEVVEAFDRSRGKMIDQSLQNFSGSPLVGIGFGVASNPHAFAIDRDPIFGLPIGASVEKGFAVTALLEETGLVGVTLFGFFLVVFLRSIAKGRSWGPMWLAVTALMTNFGEYTIFSFGANGLLVWLMIGFSWIWARSTR